MNKRIDDLLADSFEEKEVEIIRLKAQIEKMKNCNNCQHFDDDKLTYDPDYCFVSMDVGFCWSNKFPNWELKEENK